MGALRADDRQAGPGAGFVGRVLMIVHLPVWREVIEGRRPQMFPRTDVSFLAFCAAPIPLE